MDTNLTMDTNTIKASIANWTAICNNSAQINYYFGQGDCFTYEHKNYSLPSANVHAYPGIYQGKLYFFLIPATYDNAAYSTTIAQYTTVCPIQTVLGGPSDRVSAAVAKQRIKAWDSNYNIWVPQQVNSSVGIFKAFVIPTQDFEAQTSLVSLALKGNSSAAGGFKADLIITNNLGTQIVYDDFVEPVPPYGPSIYAQSNFYLLP